MRFFEAVRLALQTLRSQKLIIGVMFLIAVVSIVQGMNRYMTDKFAGTLLGVNTFRLRQYPDNQFGNVTDSTWRSWARRPRISKLLEGQDAIGREVRIFDLPYRVIGVVERQGNLLGLSLDKFAVAPASSPVKRWVNPPRVIGLMVGGVGVVAIMMISVTERTREIGVRKALGATRSAIMWQFLVEAATLTSIGGAIGMLAGGGVAWILSVVTPIPAYVPVWSVVVALAASALTGIGFGLYPANRAARLDPVGALRYE